MSLLVIRLNEASLKSERSLAVKVLALRFTEQ